MRKLFLLLILILFVVASCQIRELSKTQAELDIDDCNTNPREDDLCKCEEYNYIDKEAGGYADEACNYFYKWGHADCAAEAKQYVDSMNWSTNESKYISQIKYEMYCEQRKIRTSGDFQRFCQITCGKSRPKTDYEKHPEDYVAEIKLISNCSSKVSDSEINISLSQMEIWATQCLNQKVNCNISCSLGNQTTYRLKNECEKGNDRYILSNISIDCSLTANADWVTASCYESTESVCRLKNQCELNNPDWVEETNPNYQEEFGWINNSIWWFCDWVPTNYPNETGDEYIPSYADKCDYYKKELLKLNQTICREKTEVEKLMDKDCKNLFDEIIKWNCKSEGLISKECAERKQAWRLKGCKI